MKATVTKQLYSVSLEYNIEADSPAKAIDRVLGANILSPLKISCEPVEVTVDDDDDD